MGWTYKQRKWRDQMRAAYKEETGSEDYTAPEFAAWVEERLANQDTGEP